MLDSARQSPRPNTLENIPGFIVSKGFDHRTGYRTSKITSNVILCAWIHDENFLPYFLLPFANFLLQSYPSMNRDLLICSFSILLSTLPATAIGQEEDPPAALETTTVSATAPAPSGQAKVEARSDIQRELSPTVATRTPLPEDAIVPAYDTVSAAELTQYQRRDLADTLRQSAGVTLVSTGQAGAQTSTFIRGFESNHTVFLLNGRRLPPGLAGIYQPEFLVTDFLEEVQLVRGPVSSLWGSDALAGAVDLRSTDARFVDDDLIETFAEGGSFDSFRTGSKISLREGAVGLSLEGTHFQTNNDRPSSDFENRNFRGNVAVDLADGVWFDLLGYVQHAELGVPGSSLSEFFPEPQRNDNQSALFSPRFTIERDDWSFSSFYSYTENTLEATRDVFFQDNRLEQTGHETEAVFHYHPTDAATWTLGSGHYQHEFQRMPLSNGLFVTPADFRYSYTSVFGQADVELPADFRFLGSVRHDAQDEFESATTYNLELHRDFAATGTTLFAKTGTGYKVPSGQDFVFLAPGFDPATLSPEESESWEVGFRQNLPDNLGSLSLSYFQADIENLIDVDPFTFVLPAQVDTETEGVELELRTSPCDSLDLYATWTWLDATITDGQYSAGFGGSPGDRLPRRPRHTVTGGAVHHGDGWKVGAEIQGSYNRYDSPGVLLGDYTLARVFGSLDLNDRATVYARLENLFDSEYESTRGYEGSGFGAFGGVRMVFGE